ncbi:hypothetical protein H3146_14500 [Streptomyces sp. OF3]|uniref:Secreted protein n=1 Tax=Streptomyces alkaliterrae TaxID=2213162 RepID=A0A7W3ZNB4_9ACTN|nr:hypothetical protein [Streptomyces alkaliterrae]MBB1254563.1 hypothetical protein [Streptomyces alkaliterrae]MBB1260778.1 hypothetical protein [Streptomyces alkaliterrae]
MPAVVVAAVAACATAICVRGLRREVSGLREELLAARASVPAARHTPALEEVRAVVADALAEERERELAEARAFWAAQEARDVADGLAGPEAANPGYSGYPGYPGSADYPGYGVSDVDAQLLDALLDEVGERAAGRDAGEGPGEGRAFLPRQAGPEDVETQEPAASAGPPAESGELSAARRRHPSDPRFSLSGDPVVPAPAAAPEAATVPGEHEHTITRLGLLAERRTELADVRSGPLGTLDVYVFADETTICLSPGHRETADRLGRALDDGVAPVLLGGSGVSGAYALTFACGEETVYVLADRVIASR